MSTSHHTVHCLPSHAVAMCRLKYSLLLYSFLILDVYALTCRSDGGPKESELKTIYTKCLKMQDSKNNTRNYSGDQEWKENRRNQRNNREGQMTDRDRHRDSKMDSRNERREASDRMGGSYDSSNDDRMFSNDNRMSHNNERMGSHNERMGGYDDRSDSYDRIGSRDGRIGNDGRPGSGGREDSNRNNGYGKDGNMNGRNDFQDNYGSDFPDQYGYQSTQSNRRYKREKKSENSGKRSQFNPNPKRHQDSNRSGDKNSSENNNSSKDDDKKACALHCFLENLEMTAEDGMPDRYLVTHSLTKDVNNEDLKDFLQEAIEECFQIMDNENTDDKCEFSKNLMMCLSEKGRENCDDWKDDLKF